jgi:hypothetical protein
VVDPMAEKWNQFSPYHYAGNNPLLFVDYNGEDYGLHFNHDNQTITISATYYASTSDISSAQQSVDFWNNQSGKYTYTIGKNDASVSYTVNFDLSASEVVIDPDAGSELNQLNAAVGANSTGEGNVYNVVADSELSSNTNGATSGGNYVRVKDSRKTTDTGAHEVGHTLGMGHFNKGVMTSSSSSINRSNNITKKNVSESIIYPVKGKVNYVHNTDGTGAYAGKGTVKNATNSNNIRQITVPELKKLKGKVR